jgi:UPF0755 protein
LLATIAAVVGWYLFFVPAVDVPAGQPVQIEITEGSSTTAIAELLAENGVVTNANMFRVSVRRASADGELRAGVYDLSTGMPDDDVIDALVAGPSIAYFTVTIPEGFVVEQIAKRMEAEADIPAEEFRALALGGADRFVPDHPYLADAYKGSLEGYLFPKTYRIVEGSTATDVIEMMLDQFDREIEAVDLDPALGAGFTLPEIVTLASTIEREARVADERPLVSSVIYNRLDKNMRLELCATVEYVLPGNNLRLTDEDLKIDSPYNTYRNAGLPPGPIANPGLASLQAAVAPADTDYLYYVLTGEDGSHTFTATYEEFLAAKQRSKEVFGE